MATHQHMPCTQHFPFPVEGDQQPTLNVPKEGKYQQATQHALVEGNPPVGQVRWQSSTSDQHLVGTMVGSREIIADPEVLMWQSSTMRNVGHRGGEMLLPKGAVVTWHESTWTRLMMKSPGWRWSLRPCSITTMYLSVVLCLRGHWVTDSHYKLTLNGRGITSVPFAPALLRVGSE